MQPISRSIPAPTESRVPGTIREPCIIGIILTGETLLIRRRDAADAHYRRPANWWRDRREGNLQRDAEQRDYFSEGTVPTVYFHWIIVVFVSWFLRVIRCFIRFCGRRGNERAFDYPCGCAPIENCILRNERNSVSRVVDRAMILYHELMMNYF